MGGRPAEIKGLPTMQQTFVRNSSILSWATRDSRGVSRDGRVSTPYAEPRPAQSSPPLSVSHINGCVVIGPPRRETAELRPQPLSGRETEVLALVAEGNGNKEIGATLHISERTVKNHLTGIMTKLRASDRTHAVVTAVRLGWLAI